MAFNLLKSGAPGGNRTHDNLLRRQMLYPTELRAQPGFCRIPACIYYACLSGKGKFIRKRLKIEFRSLQANMQVLKADRERNGRERAAISRTLSRRFALAGTAPNFAPAFGLRAIEHRCARLGNDALFRNSRRSHFGVRVKTGPFSAGRLRAGGILRNLRQKPSGLGQTVRN